MNLNQALCYNRESLNCTVNFDYWSIFKTTNNIEIASALKWWTNIQYVFARIITQMCLTNYRQGTTKEIMSSRGRCNRITTTVKYNFTQRNGEKYRSSVHAMCNVAYKTCTHFNMILKALLAKAIIMLHSSLPSIIYSIHEVLFVVTAIIITTYPTLKSIQNKYMPKLYLMPSYWFTISL